MHECSKSGKSGVGAPRNKRIMIGNGRARKEFRSRHKNVNLT